MVKNQKKKKKMMIKILWFAPFSHAKKHSSTQEISRLTFALM